MRCKREKNDDETVYTRMRVDALACENTRCLVPFSKDGSIGNMVGNSHRLVNWPYLSFFYYSSGNWKKKAIIRYPQNA